MYTLLWWLCGEEMRDESVVMVHAVASLVTNMLVLQTLAQKSMRSGLQRLVWFILIVINTQTTYKMGISHATNDVFGTLMAALMLVGIERKWYWLSSIMFASAVSFKMNALLYGPALLLVYLHSMPFLRVVAHFAIMGLFQVAVALPFLLHDWRAYIRIAFNFGRDFNNSTNIAWTFLGDDLRQKDYFYKFLFVCTIGFLLAFLWMSHLVLSQFGRLKRWVLSHDEPRRANPSHDAMHLLDQHETEWKLFAITASNFISFAFVRGLHPQFSLWIFFYLPFVLYLIIVRQPRTLELDVKRAIHKISDAELEQQNTRNELSWYRWLKMGIIYFVMDWCLAHHRHVLRLSKLWDGLLGLLRLDMDALFDSDAFFGRLGAFDWVKIGIFNMNFNAGKYVGDYYRELGYLWREHFSITVWPGSLILFLICCYTMQKVFEHAHNSLRVLRNVKAKTI